MPWIRRVRTSQPLDANVGLTDGGLFSKNSVALALNFAGGSRPIQTAGKSLAWSGSTSATTAGTPQGVGLYDPSTSSGLVYGAARSFDGFSPANSPCFFALSFVYGAFVNQGSGANVLWTYGGSGGTGFYVRSASTNVLTVQFVNTTLATPALVAGKSYHLVGGRDAAGNCWLWLNNALVASGTGATGADSASSNSMRFLDDGAGNRTFKGSISGLILSRDDPRYFGKELSANPWQAYEPELVWVPVSAGGSSVITSAAGTSTASTLAATATAATVPTAAAGASIASTIAAAATAATALTSAAGTSTAGTLAATAAAATAPTAAAGTSTTSTLAGAAGAASMTAADGISTTSTLAGSSVASAALTAAAGTSTSGTLSTPGVTAAAMVPATGATTAAPFAASATAAAVAIAAAGVTSAQSLSSLPAAEDTFTGPSRTRIGDRVQYADPLAFTSRTPKARIGSPAL